jgi:hypothetical protein
MKRAIKNFVFILIIISTQLSVNAAVFNAAFTENSAFWINKIDKKYSENLIINSGQIQAFNNKIDLSCKEIVDIKSFGDTITKNKLQGMIDTFKLSSNNYIIKPYKNMAIILKNRSMDKIKNISNIKYGVAVKDTYIRSFPTSSGAYKNSSDAVKDKFDRFQETLCQALEPVAILHTSSDNMWYFIQMYNYYGWVKKSDVAVFNNKKEMLDYTSNKKILTVIGKEIKISNNTFTLGTYLPYMANAGGYNIKLPTINNNGYVAFKEYFIAKNPLLNEGYLPYTSSNILKEAFKLKGVPYGWGDKNGRDCSSFIMYVYKTFGIRFPRNADQQENTVGTKYNLINGSASERTKAFQNVFPGACVYKNGHAMIYIGMIENVPYIIHDFNIVIRNGRKVSVDKVAVTSTSEISSSGVEFLKTFTSIKEFK